MAFDRACRASIELPELRNLELTDMNGRICRKEEILNLNRRNEPEPVNQVGVRRSSECPLGRRLPYGDS